MLHVVLIFQGLHEADHLRNLRAFQLDVVLEAVKKGNFPVTTSEVAMLPQNYIKLEGPQVTQMIRLI